MHKVSRPDFRAAGLQLQLSLSACCSCWSSLHAGDGQSGSTDHGLCQVEVQDEVLIGNMPLQLGIILQLKGHASIVDESPCQLAFIRSGGCANDCMARTSMLGKLFL